MAKPGRPRKNFDKKMFVDLVGLGCTEKEICWFFRDDNGRPVKEDTLSRWCKREFGMNFADFFRYNSGFARNISIRRNQLSLTKKSATMAIFLGKNYLGQRDSFEDHADTEDHLEELMATLMPRGASRDEEDEVDDV